MKRSGEGWRDAVPVAALLLLTAAVFGQAAFFGFTTLDDAIYVAKNPHLASGLTPAALRWAFTATYASNWHPLSWISHLADVELFGMSAGAHHLSSVLLHAATVVLLYRVLSALTGARRRSALAAALFAIHPLHVESVAWVAERKDVLAGLFWVLTLAAYLRHLRRPGRGPYLVLLLSYLLGLMAKPVLVTLPFALLLLDWWPLGRLRGGQGAGLPTAARVLREKVPLLAAACAASVITYRAQAASGAVDRYYPLAERLANAIVSYARYLGKTLWPAHLSLFYPYPLDSWPVGTTVAALLLLLLLSGLAFRSRRRLPALFAGWLWYLGTLVPMIGIVQVGGQALADRYTYIPLIGLFIAAAWAVPEGLRPWPAARRVLPALAGAAIVALAVTAWFQTRLWGDTLRLYAHAARAAPGNWVAHTLLGIEHAAQGRAPQAEGEFLLALAANPAYYGAHAHLAKLYAGQGRREPSREHLRQAQALDPISAASDGLAILEASLAVPARRDPASDTVLVGEHVSKAGLLAAADRLAEAQVELEAALRIEPGYPPALNNLGAVRARRGDFAGAERYFREALAKRPDFAEAHNNLGHVLVRRGDLEEAERAAREALRLKPDSTEYRNTLHRILSRRGSAEEPPAR